MNKDKMIRLLNDDLRNEWKHMRFYLYHASAVQSLHREELKEVFQEQATSEMGHVLAFSDLIRGLDGSPTQESNEFLMFSDPVDILQAAVRMEQEVVTNYVQRIKDAAELGGDDGQWLEIFLEGQIQDSREDVDNFRQMLRGKQ